MDYDYEAQEEVVAEVMHRIQSHVYPRRLRAKEYFLDHDPLRHGRCTKINFERGIAGMGIDLKDYEVQCLADHFTERGPQIQEPQVVSYTKFCAAVDQVFSQHGETSWGIASQRASPMGGAGGMSLSGATLLAHIPGSFEDEEKLDKMLQKIAALCKTRGVTFKDCYTDHDRAPIASPARMHPVRGGKCSKNQFLRGFPFKKEFNAEDLKFLANQYCTDDITVHFMALHHEVSEFMVHEQQPFPQSPLTVKPDDTEWSHGRLRPVDKLRAKIVERRVRVSDQFKDFDPLRKGLVTMGQVKTVFTILNIAKELTSEDFDQIVCAYTSGDSGLFCYTAFCKDVESDFTTPYLEKQPRATISMPDRSHTAPARRNPIVLPRERVKKIEALEAKMRYRVRTRGLAMKPSFQDLDKARRGYVTKAQFGRVLTTLGFEVNQAEVDLLCQGYCNLGNHTDVNYVDFIAALDAADEDHQLALEQASGPVGVLSPSKYFDDNGRVHKAIGVM